MGITFEECARLIALQSQTYVIAERGYQVVGTVSAAAASRIEEVVSRVGKSGFPDFPALVDEILGVGDDEQVERPVIVDLYLKDRDGREYFFEMKSPRPNKGQCLEVTERLLRVYALKRQGPPTVNAYFAMAYNPYGSRREDYRHSFSLRYLNMEHEVLLGPEFWTLVGGEGAYEELLAIYREVGNALGKAMVDALAFGFYH